MKVKIVLYSSILFLLTFSSTVAMACPPPTCQDCEILQGGQCVWQCDECEDCNDGECEVIGDGCTGDGDCGDCESCYLCYCHDECSSSQVCCGGDECKECCNTSDCDYGEVCCNDGECEECCFDSDCDGDDVCCEDRGCEECCDLYDCPACYYCYHWECKCNEVTGVSGISGPYYQGDTENVSVTLTRTWRPGCSITWGGGASISGSGTSETATFNTTGTGLTITAKTADCQSTPEVSSTFTVVRISQFEAKSSNFPKCVGDSISESDFNITTDPTGYEGDVLVTGLSTSSAGYKTAQATLWDKPDPALGASYTVVGISGISGESADPVIAGEDVMYTVVTNPSGYGSLVNWSGGGSPATGTGSSFTTNWGSGGTKTVTASCGSSSDSEDTIVVAIGVGDVTFSPGTLIADGTSTSTASATITPSGRTITWSIEGSTLGCTINSSTGLITAGTTGGTITVRATDSVLSSCYSEATLNVVAVNGVTFSPSKLTADGVSTSTASATIEPSGRTITWSIEGDAKGCTINSSTGLITAGTTTGTITVRAADSALSSCYAEATIDINENIGVVIDTPSSFVHIELGNSLQLDCTPSGVTTGSYTWSQVSGPGIVTFSNPNIKNPTFSVDQSGSYTVKVDYTVGGTTVSNISSIIFVVEVVEIISSTDVASFGEDVMFGAITNPPNSASYVTVTWSGGGNPATGSGSLFTTNWSTTGTKTVTVTCGTSSTQKSVDIIDIVINTPGFPAYVELGNSLQLDCTPIGVTTGGYTWSKVSGPGGVTFSDTNIKNPTFSADQSGSYTVKVDYTVGDTTISEISGTINVVEVVNVIASADAAAIGEDVTFEAITYPPDMANYVNVTWSGGGTPATGNDSQFTTNWSAAGTKTVTATCSSSSSQKSVDIVNVSNITFTPDTLIADGVSSSDADVAVTPSTRTIIWSIVGDALGCTIDSSTGIITAGTTTGTITVKAADSVLSSCYAEATIDILNIDISVEITSCPDLLAMNSTATASATITPSGRAITWSIKGYALGCTINSSTGEITTGTSTIGGIVYIKAADSEFPDIYYDCDYFVLSGNGVEITLPENYPASVELGGQLPLDCNPYFNDPTYTTYGWEKVSGPGIVTFSDPGIKNPTFSADQSGTYTVKVNNTITINDTVIDTSSDTSGEIIFIDVQNVTFLPGTLLPDGVSTSTASATTTPSGRTLTWSIEGDSLGCTIDPSTGEITAGTTEGTITVRATDSALSSCYAEAAIDIVDLDIQNVTFSPPEIAVDGSTSTATATTIPSGRTLTWSIEGDALGCSIGPSTGIITSGATGGTITVRATDSVIPACYAEATIDVVAVQNVTFSSSTLLPDGNSTSKAMAKTAPAGRTIIWSIVGDDLGCIINSSTGLIRAGTTEGTITARATDSVLSSCHAEASIDIIGTIQIEIESCPSMFEADGDSYFMAIAKTTPTGRNVNWSIVGEDLDCTITPDPNDQLKAKIQTGKEAGILKIKAADSVLPDRYAEADTDLWVFKITHPDDQYTGPDPRPKILFTKACDLSSLHDVFSTGLVARLWGPGYPVDHSGPCFWGKVSGSGNVELEPVQDFMSSWGVGWIQTRFWADTPDTYIVKCTYTNDESGFTMDDESGEIIVYDFEGPEVTYVYRNNNDSDLNGIQDWRQAKPDPGDEDLVKITVNVISPRGDDEVELDISSLNLSFNSRVWDENVVEEIRDGKRWKVSDFPITLNVEGIDTSRRNLYFMYVAVYNDDCKVIQDRIYRKYTCPIEVVERKTITVNLTDPLVNGVRSGLDIDTLRFELNGNVTDNSKLTILPTYDSIETDLVTDLTITYVPLASDLIPGINTVKVDIDDMVDNHMDQIVTTFRMDN